MKKKGFTLVELLTVIAILTIILLIAIPTILDILDKANKNAFKSQVLLYIESLKQQVSLISLNQADIDIILPGIEGSTLVNIQDIVMDINTNLMGSIKIKNEGGNYKYYLVGINNGDYKIIKEVEAKNLTVDVIGKNH